MNDTNFVENFSYNNDGRIKQYVKRFFGELLNTCGDIEPKLLWHVMTHEIGHGIYNTFLVSGDYNNGEIYPELFLLQIYNCANFDKKYIGKKK